MILLSDHIKNKKLYNVISNFKTWKFTILRIIKMKLGLNAGLSFPMINVVPKHLNGASLVFELRNESKKMLGAFLRHRMRVASELLL